MTALDGQAAAREAAGMASPYGSDVFHASGHGVIVIVKRDPDTGRVVVDVDGAPDEGLVVHVNDHLVHEEHPHG